jgi:hypothetical protein
MKFKLSKSEILEWDGEVTLMLKYEPCDDSSGQVFWRFVAQSETVSPFAKYFLLSNHEI